MRGNIFSCFYLYLNTHTIHVLYTTENTIFTVMDNSEHHVCVYFFFLKIQLLLQWNLKTLKNALKWSRYETWWSVINKLNMLKQFHLKHFFFLGSGWNKDSWQQQVQPHISPACSQPTRPQSGLFPAVPAPQRQSADWQEVNDDGGRELGQPNGTWFWTGEDT